MDQESNTYAMLNIATRNRYVFMNRKQETHITCFKKCPMNSFKIDWCIIRIH